MSWKSQKHLKRIYNLFKRAKDKKILFQEDLDAFKELNDEIDELTAYKVKDHVLLKKLMLYVFFSDINNGYTIEQSIKNLDRVFKNSTLYYLEILTKTLNNNSINEYFKSIGLEEKDFTKIRTKEELDKEIEIISKNQKEMVLKLNSNYSVEQVEKSFVRTINEFINDINNYK